MPERVFRDYYEILGVAQKATGEYIRRAYRDLVRIYHPDTLVGKPDSVRKRAEEQFKRVQEAYECLSNPRARTEYDARWREFHARSSEPGRSQRSDQRVKRQMWSCLECGKRNGISRAFCADCGSSRDNALEVLRRSDHATALRKQRAQLKRQGYEICAACGRFQNRRDASFCGGCGQDLGDFWAEGGYEEDYNGGFLARYAMHPDEIFEAVLETFRGEEIAQVENIDRRTVVKLPKGLLASAELEIQVAQPPGENTFLLVVPRTGAGGNRDLCHRALVRVQRTIDENRFGKH